MATKKRKPRAKTRVAWSLLTEDLARSLLRAAERATEFELDARDAVAQVRSLTRRLEALEGKLAATAGLIARAREAVPVQVENPAGDYVANMLIRTERQLNPVVAAAIASLDDDGDYDPRCKCGAQLEHAHTMCTTCEEEQDATQ